MIQTQCFVIKCRRTSEAWRPLGYIANENIFFSGVERNENHADGKSHRFHLILDAILQSFKDAQRPGALRNSSVRLGKHKKIVNLYVPLQFIIGDVEGGDQLCSRYSYRGIASPRLCRTCDVSTENCGRTDIECKRIEVAHIRQLYEEQNLEALKALAQRPTFNCLYDIDCGKDPYGIFSMVHTEGLHALEVGVMKYMVEILLEELPNSKHGDLDRLVKRLNALPHQHGYAGFPRLLWSDGVTTLTQLTGDQRVGKMFAILLVALTRDGERFFTKNLPGGQITWRRMVYCFQQILCYWAWLKQDFYWMTSDEDACEAATQSIKLMMRQLQALWPRREGLQWLLTKIHEQFHVPVDIHRNGKPANVHTGPQEHNHISAKNAAKKTQMQKRKIDLQTGERIVDRLILQRAYDRVRETVREMDEALEHHERLDADTNGIDDTIEDDNGVVRNATKGTVEMVQDVPKTNKKKQMPPVLAGIQWKTGRNNTVRENILLQEYVLGFLIEIFFQDHAQVGPRKKGKKQRTLSLKCFTEYQRNGIIYRCHPMYRGEYPYYDWCQIKWKIGETEVDLLGRIHLFIETPEGEIKAVVQSVLHGTEEAHGIFGSYWFLESNGNKPRLALAELVQLGDPAMVLPYESGGQRYIHYHEREKWAGYFIAMEGV
jgi:hypothetical protein